jgi:hypothetical protein
MKKLCTDEVGGVKMKKNERKCVLQFEKTYLKKYIFTAPLALHFKNDL